MFVKPKTTIKTLIEEFEYPRFGPGMMWNAVKERIEERGGSVRTDSDVAAISRNNGKINSVTISVNGHKEDISGTEFISSMPLTEFIKKLDPPPPPAVIQAANKIHYRDFLTVCLIVNQRDLFPDNWVYIHDPEVKVGRIQNFKNWSPEMVPDPAKSSLGLEYFCNEGDELWNMRDDELIELGKREVDRIGLARYADIDDGCVCRVPKAYPVYDADYREYLDTVREFVGNFKNFHTIGRNGLHRYNNQDHAMLTGMFAARNMVLGERNDLWSVNADQEYLEEMLDENEIEPALQTVKEALAQAFPKLDRVALALSLGAVSGVVLLLATLALVLKGGEVVGPNLALLQNYFPGYAVTIQGSILGLVYGFATGFLGGWGFAFCRNFALFLYTAVMQQRTERMLLRKLLEYM
jgi:hypothetical protein